ncbi:MAG: hydrogenase expression/formation protein HypE [Nitrospinae bacterium]|nr:hydrogenase expression/formation protein HypE [Nitrospinota bacterium]
MTPRDGIVLLGHGSGGAMSRDLLENVIIPALHEDGAAQQMEDAARLTLPSGQLSFTTDSYVVDPIFFPGGDIGELAVNGTINDLAMSGARPVALSVAFIIEEGLAVDDLRRVARSAGRAAKAAGVAIVCGDTKVVPKGRGDKIYVNTSGVGLARGNVNVSAANARPGDVILVNGTIGDHGVAIMSVREGLAFESPVKSDTAALHTLVDALADAGVELHEMRDPTRGGLATVMVEIAQASGVAIRLDERQAPMDPAVAGACEILGLDPLVVANEGKMIAIVPGADADKALKAMRAHPLGVKAAVIGEVTGPSAKGKVTLTSMVGGERVISMLQGELLPRIC